MILYVKTVPVCEIKRVYEENMKKKSSIIMSLAIFILLALSFNQNNLDISADSQITTGDNENQISDFSNQNYIPRNSANYDPGAKYEWWSSNWTFRIPLAVNSTYINRTDFSIKIEDKDFDIVHLQADVILCLVAAHDTRPSRLKNPCSFPRRPGPRSFRVPATGSRSSAWV